MNFWNPFSEIVTKFRKKVLLLLLESFKIHYVFTLSFLDVRSFGTVLFPLLQVVLQSVTILLLN